ncbi:MAG: 1-phosphofructokinase [Tissierellia bacterium]|nr:1-phosphofructokinase [Tissierellia bacterium]
MIYTLTLNPALDHVVRLKDLKLGETNRMDQEKLSAGGKGINVSKLLKNLGERSIAFAFVAGFTGQELERILRDKEGILCDFVHVSKGFTRINVKIKAEEETEINGPGLSPSDEEISLMLRKFEDLKDGDYLFLSGSIPSSLDKSFYRQIMEKVKGKDVKIAVDTLGEALKETLDLGPYLIKPNKRELEDFFQVEINNNQEIIEYASKLQELGAQNIIVSLGADGAYFLSKEGESIFMDAPKGQVVDTVGAGDSVVAGFMYAIKNGFTLRDAFAFGVACGSATAFSSNLATKEEIFNLYNNYRGRK